jgi:hypothetical protein
VAAAPAWLIEAVRSKLSESLRDQVDRKRQKAASRVD